ncbi:unnamed protein product, partial [Rotaria socialis]
MKLAWPFPRLLNITLRNSDLRLNLIVAPRKALITEIRLKKFCSRFNIKLSNVIDEYTTHLITAEEDETLVCPLSKKVIQAVARHMYILTYRWIDTCLTMNKIINEKIFEIQGDSTLSSNHNGMQRSRQSNLAHNLP